MIHLFVGEGVMVRAMNHRVDPHGSAMVLGAAERVSPHMPRAIVIIIIILYCILPTYLLKCNCTSQSLVCALVCGAFPHGPPLDRLVQH